ncbi:MAG: NAD(+)/NADH kinase [Ktedonobacteraceae bacterium]|nr:NAD(+)/NADH kinase [Ktedonobacteraceae bacterium]
MKTIAIFYQGLKDDTFRFAAQLVPILEKQGHRVRSVDIRTEGPECADPSFRDYDMALVLGGDGTIVHAARLCACINLPIIGINFGRVGFLTELEPDEVEKDLSHFLNGDKSVWVDERAMLRGVLKQDGQEEEFLALNDIVIARGTWPRGVRIHVWVDDYYYNTTYSDGMILSTATGSTAYNMSVGGPLLHPQVRSLVLSPIAPHLAANRSLVLQPEAKVHLQIFTNAQNGVFSADGQLNREVKDGATVTVEKSPYITRFLRRRPPTYFYQIINAKLKNDGMPASESHHVT